MLLMLTGRVEECSVYRLSLLKRWAEFRASYVPRSVFWVMVRWGIVV